MENNLFGPASGDGFKELAKYDEDKNGWIDKGDTVFKRLRIWTKDEGGKDRMFAAVRENIGAIYVGNIEGPYSHQSEKNYKIAINKRRGFYLGNDGYGRFHSRSRFYCLEYRRRYGN